MQPPVLTFRASPLRGEVAWLGQVMVGEVFAVMRGRREAVSWLLCLTDHRRQGLAASREAARVQIEQAVNDWFSRTGVFMPGEGVRVLVEGTGARRYG